jgi:hypothetical protein
MPPLPTVIHNYTRSTVMKAERLAEILEETWSVPVNTLSEILEVKRPNIYKMVQTNKRLRHLIIEDGRVVNTQKRFQMDEVDVLPQYVLRVILRDSPGFVRLAMNWADLSLDTVREVLNTEDFHPATLDELPDEHICSIIRMFMFYLLERPQREITTSLETPS